MRITEMSKILSRAYLSYPHLELDEATTTAWFADFRDEDAATFDAALREARLTGGDFFPSPASVFQILEKAKIKNKPADHSADREYREATFRSDWAKGIVWIVEHKENHKVIAKERKEFVESGIWADKKLTKRITHDGVISYHFGESYPAYQSQSDKEQRV